MNHAFFPSFTALSPGGRSAFTRAALLMAAALSLSACSLPQAPIIRAPQGSAASSEVTADRLDEVLKPGSAVPVVEVLLLGEQHDAPDHHQIEQQVVATLAARGVLAAVALEMADAGATTALLKPRSSEAQTRLALNWQDDSWPWAAYGPAVMAAVRAGVPVMGANLPKSAMRTSMADRQLDSQLPGPALKAQQQLIRIGHCNLLPETQITPMTRIQIAKDMQMAKTVSEAAVPGKVVVLITGSAHANKQLGVPQHLAKALHAKSVLLLAGDGPDQDQAFDATWGTPSVPEVDYCAGLREQFKAK
jgi:uncharacterized iron-regulated protein